MTKAPKDDHEIWGRVSKGVTPLRRKPKARAAAPEPAPAPAKAAKPAKAKPAKAKAPPSAKPPAPLPPLAPGQAPGFDARSHEKFRAGKMPVEARIDLHGHTLEAAHRELAAFIQKAWERDKRMLLVITGKGGRNRDEHGHVRATIRYSVPRWLNEPGSRRRILAIAQARPQHGGAGALYVLLKRKRA